MKHYAQTVLLWGVVAGCFLTFLPRETVAAEESVWCCRQDVVVMTTEKICKKTGGKAFASRKTALSQCRRSISRWPYPQLSSPLLSFSNKRPVTKKKMERQLQRDPGMVMVRKIPVPGGYKTIENPGHPPIPAGPDCSCEVFQWITDANDPAVYFRDESFDVNYSVDCATGVTVGSTEFISTRRQLEAAEDGLITEGGSWGTHYEDAEAAGRLSGSHTIAADTANPGVYIRMIGGNNSENPGSASCTENLRYHVIERPHNDGTCSEVNTCIYNMLREIRSLVSRYITNNEHLNTQVAAFADGILERRVIGLKIERELEVMAGRGTRFVCQECPAEGGIHWDEATPERVYVSYCIDNPNPADDWTFSDYSVLHELTHKVGFNTDLINAYVAAGLWDRDDPTNHSKVEGMTFTVSGAPWEEREVRSQGCWAYDDSW